MNRPNILFITAEDICPDLGCYGDVNAVTPNLDKFAEESIRFTNTYSVHPCCSPSRSCLMTGIYPTRLGTFQHRGRVELYPEDVRTMTSLLRDSGYYTFNGFGCEGGRAKDDYNFRPLDHPWDIYNSKEWEWHNRLDGQPFFAQVNFMQTHQSMYGLREPYTGTYETHHPDKMVLPSYHPDVPGVREIWCEYHERMTEMDGYFGKLLQKLEEDGLAEDTIIIFIGDNGMGIPAGKVWIWEQGLHVPMMIKVPNKFKHLIDVSQPSVYEEMTSFLDFAPTILNWCGVQIDPKMQGRVMLQNETNEEIYAARDLHEESDFDFSRVVRNKDFHYIRNFMPHIGWEAMPYAWSRAPYMLNDWYNAAKEGLLDKTNRTGCFFVNEKPLEELYDVKNDPHQMNNLALDSTYQDVLAEMREKCENWIIRNNDLGFLSQNEMYKRSKEIRTYQLASDNVLNPIEKLLQAANLANERNIKNIEKIKLLIQNPDNAIRRWGAIALVSLTEQNNESERFIKELLHDSCSDVQRICAEYFLSKKYCEQSFQIIKNQLTDQNGFVRYHALIAITRLDENSKLFLPYIDASLEECDNRKWGSYDQLPTLVNIIKGMWDTNNKDRYKARPVLFMD